MGLQAKPKANSGPSLQEFRMRKGQDCPSFVVHAQTPLSTQPLCPPSPQAYSRIPITRTSASLRSCDPRTSANPSSPPSTSPSPWTSSAARRLSSSNNSTWRFCRRSSMWTLTSIWSICRASRTSLRYASYQIQAGRRVVADELTRFVR